MLCEENIRKHTKNIQNRYESDQNGIKIRNAIRNDKKQTDIEFIAEL